MEGQEFIFALQDKLHRFWGVDVSGNVTISSQPYFLKFSPDGWADLQVSNVRNKKYWGIDRSVSVPLSYVMDGAKILKYIFLTKGIEESVYLSISVQELDYTAGTSFGFWYRQIFKGEVDLSTYLHAGIKVTCSTLEDGLPKFLKSNENTVYEFPMNVPESIWVKMDGITLHNKVNYGMYELQESGSAITGGKSFGTMPFILTSQEGDGYGLVYLPVNDELISNDNGDDNGYMQNSANWLVSNQGEVPVTFPLTGHIDLLCVENGFSFLGPAGMTLYFKTSISHTYYRVTNNVIITTGNSYVYAVNFSVDLLPGESLYSFRSFIRTDEVNTDIVIQYKETSELFITANTRRPTTYIRALTAQYLFSRLVNKFTEANYVAAASAYFTRYSQKVFTCGNAIRGLDSPVMKISWSIFFKDWDSFDSIGITDSAGIIDFDTKENLIDFTNKIQLKAPADGSFKVSIAKEFLFNEAEFGYPEIKNEIGQLNGNEEFNSKFLFSFGATKSPAKLDKISPIKASCYEIEKIRTTNLEKDTTDYKDDNDIFSLFLEPTTNAASGAIPEHYKLDRTLNASATGLIEPLTVFNLALSPKRNIIRNGPFMRSSMYLADQLVLAYQSSDRNKNLVCDGIIESADVPVPNMGTKYFLPLTLEGDFPAPENLEVLLDLNPEQIFTFPLDGYDLDGIFIKVSVAPSKRDLQNYQFLSTAYNPIEKLIEYYG